MEASAAKAKLELLTLENVAEYLHLHRTTIHRMVNRKQLQGFKLGGEWRFDPESIERWRAVAEQNVKRAGSASGCTTIPVRPSRRLTTSRHGRHVRVTLNGNLEPDGLQLKPYKRHSGLEPYRVAGAQSLRIMSPTF